MGLRRMTAHRHRLHPQPCHYPLFRGEIWLRQGIAPRTSACGSSSVQIPPPWACLAPAGESGQPLPAEGSTGHVGHTYPVGTGDRGGLHQMKGGQGLSPRWGEDLAFPPFPPSTGPAAAGGGGTQSPVQGGRESRRALRGHRSPHFHTHSVPTLSVVAPPVTV